MCDDGITERKRKIKRASCSGKRKVQKVASLEVKVRCLRGNEQ